MKPTLLEVPESNMTKLKPDANINKSNIDVSSRNPSTPAIPTNNVNTNSIDKPDETQPNFPAGMLDDDGGVFRNILNSKDETEIYHIGIIDYL